MNWNDGYLKRWAMNGGIEPCDPDMIKPASIDLRLGDKIRFPQKRWATKSCEPITMKTSPEDLWGEEITITDAGVVIPSGGVALCCSLEYITMPPDASGTLMSRSGTGRRLFEHLHCLHGDTLIDVPRDVSIHPDGVPIRKLVGRPFLTYAFDTQTMQFVITPADAFPSKRNAEVVRVDYEWMTGRQWRHGSIICTPDHRFLTLDGRWVEAQFLTGERLLPLWRWTDDRYATLRVDPLRKTILREHRFVADQVFDFDRHLQVHHIDGNKLNNNPENLQPIERGVHQSMHSAGENNPFWGKTHTDETKREFSRQRKGRKLHAKWRKSISRATSGKNNPRYIDVSLAQIISAYQETGRIKDAAQIIGIHEETLLSKIKQNGFSGTVELRKHIAAMDNHKVTSVTKLSQRIDTYDMIVPGYENFVANGVVVHNSGFFEPSFHGQATFEFVNDGPWDMRLFVGDALVQLKLEQMIEIPKISYLQTGKYNGQRGATPHRAERDAIGRSGDDR